MQTLQHSLGARQIPLVPFADISVNQCRSSPVKPFKLLPVGALCTFCVDPNDRLLLLYFILYFVLLTVT